MENKASIKMLFAQIIVISVMALIIYPLLDWLTSLIFTHSEFKYSIPEHVISPIVFGIFAGFIFWFLDYRAVKKQGKKPTKKS